MLLEILQEETMITAQNTLNVAQVLSVIAVHISLGEMFWFVHFHWFFVCLLVLFCFVIIKGNSEIEL